MLPVVALVPQLEEPSIVCLDSVQRHEPDSLSWCWEPTRQKRATSFSQVRVLYECSRFQSSSIWMTKLTQRITK